MATVSRRLVGTDYMSFPFAISDDDQKVRTSQRLAHVRQQIEQVIYTEPGERVFRPDFGAGVSALVFEPNGSILREATERRLIASLTEALAGEVDPRTLAVDVDAVEEILTITVAYQLAAIQETVSEVFQVNGSGNG